MSRVSGQAVIAAFRNLRDTHARYAARRSERAERAVVARRMPYLGPSANFAKPIVWCFVARFSERFLPDSLSALEAKSRS